MPSEIPDSRCDVCRNERMPCTDCAWDVLDAVREGRPHRGIDRARAIDRRHTDTTNRILAEKALTQ